MLVFIILYYNRVNIDLVVVKIHEKKQKTHQETDRQISSAGPESFVRGGPTLTFFVVVVFLVDEGRKDHHDTTISGPSSARQRNAI